MPYGLGKVIGAHSVSSHRLFAVAWVSGLLSCLWAIGTGIWILGHAPQLFVTPQWVEFVDFLEGDKSIPGWIILVGGLLGIIGLVARVRSLSYVSCIVCIAWGGWLSTFLWLANFEGSTNLAGAFAILSTLVFILRLWLLVITPDAGEEGGQGW